MDEGTSLTYEELCATAARLLKASRYTQKAIANEFEVSRTAIGRAVTEPGPKFQRLQIAIIEHLTDYQIRRVQHVEFIVERREARSSGADEEENS